MLALSAVNAPSKKRPGAAQRVARSRAMPAAPSAAAVQGNGPASGQLRRPLPSNNMMQAKLTVGPVNDPLEREAQRIADRVMRMPADVPPIRAASAPDARMQAAGSTRLVGAAPKPVHDVLQSRGRPLDAASRAFFEPRFVQDFGDVRVHSASDAAAAATSVSARAFTVGRNIVFGPDQYAPASFHGRQLLAHELTHVVQQRGGAPGVSSSASNVQRRIGDGHDLQSPWLSGDTRFEGAFDNETDKFLSNGSRGTAVKRVQQLLFFLGFDIGPAGADGIFGKDTEAAVRAFQTRSAPPVDGIIGPITIGALDAAANQPEPSRTAPGAIPAGPPTGTPPAISVDRIDVVDSAAGAIGGFPAIVGGASLNTPGPFNSPTEVKNSLQIHFHLDHGSSADLTPLREIQRTSTVAAGAVSNNPPNQVLPPGVAGPPAPGGFTGVLIGNDGPAAHEIQRPTADTIVVADAPGLQGMVPASHPVTYRAHFILTVSDTRGAPIARANYDVLIDKRSVADVPNTENRVVTTAKRDFVRGKDL